MKASFWSSWFADRRATLRTLLLIGIVAMFAASFLAGGELYATRGEVPGAGYPVMSDAGIAYTALLPAMISWSRFVLFGALFWLLRDGRADKRRRVGG